MHYCKLFVVSLGFGNSSFESLQSHFSHIHSKFKLSDNKLQTSALRISGSDALHTPNRFRLI